MIRKVIRVGVREKNDNGKECVVSIVPQLSVPVKMKDVRKGSCLSNLPILTLDIFILFKNICAVMNLHEPLNAVTTSSVVAECRPQSVSCVDSAKFFIAHHMHILPG